MIYVAVDKSSKDEENWKVHHCKLVKESDIRFHKFYEQCANDISDIFSQVKNKLNNPNEMLHTTNGKYLQIRTKDSKPYHPIYSRIYRKNVSDKNHAFYFKKEFVFDIKRRVSCT
jgi:DNA mismatch repair protein MutH